MTNDTRLIPYVACHPNYGIIETFIDPDPFFGS